jgi:hypothetical protein
VFGEFPDLMVMDTTGCWCRALPRFLTPTPIGEVLPFLGSVGSLGAPGEALCLTVGVT